MKANPSSPQDRRAFFRQAGRSVALGTMGIFGLLLYGRQRRNPEVCINRSVCGTCRVFGECELPAARSAKQARGAGA